MRHHLPALVALLLLLAPLSLSQAQPSAQTSQPAQLPQPAAGTTGAQPAADTQGTQPVAAPQGAQPAAAPQGAQPVQAATADSGAQPVADTQGTQQVADTQGTQPVAATQGTQGAQPAQGATGGSGVQDLQEVPVGNGTQTTQPGQNASAGNGTSAKGAPVVFGGGGQAITDAEADAQSRAAAADANSALAPVDDPNDPLYEPFPSPITDDGDVFDYILPMRDVLVPNLMLYSEYYCMHLLTYNISVLNYTTGCPKTHQAVPADYVGCLDRTHYVPVAPVNGACPQSAMLFNILMWMCLYSDTDDYGKCKPGSRLLPKNNPDAAPLLYCINSDYSVFVSSSPNTCSEGVNATRSMYRLICHDATKGMAMVTYDGICAPGFNLMDAAHYNGTDVNGTIFISSMVAFTLKNPDIVYPVDISSPLQYEKNINDAITLENTYFMASLQQAQQDTAVAGNGTDGAAGSGTDVAGGATASGDGTSSVADGGGAAAGNSGASPVVDGGGTADGGDGTSPVADVAVAGSGASPTGGATPVTQSASPAA